jgi:hypothetical protein
MRIFLFFFGTLAVILNLSAAPQTLKISPATLTGWTVTGADPTSMAALPGLSVPSGAQLAHSFQSPLLAVQLSSPLLIGADSSNWPVIEIGSAALVFSRVESAGRLILVVGDNSPVELPVTFALDADGRSIELLDITFAKDDSILTIQVLGKTLDFPAGNDPAKDLELVISSGKTEPWSFDDLQVTVDSNEVVNPTGDTSSGRTTPKPTDSSAAEKGKSARGGALVTDRISNSSGTDATATKLSETKGSDTLEIFTQPAVRQGRADIVRATAEQTRKK